MKKYYVHRAYWQSDLVLAAQLLGIGFSHIIYSGRNLQGNKFDKFDNMLTFQDALRIIRNESVLEAFLYCWDQLSHDQKMLCKKYHVDRYAMHFIETGFDDDLNLYDDYESRVNKDFSSYFYESSALLKPDGTLPC